MNGSRRRDALARYAAQARFHERGQAAWEHYQRTGWYVPAGEVLARLQAKLNARRKQLGK
jgi:predicted transcriptional regulator